MVDLPSWMVVGGWFLKIVVGGFGPWKKHPPPSRWSLSESMVWIWVPRKALQRFRKMPPDDTFRPDFGEVPPPREVLKRSPAIGVNRSVSIFLFALH